MLLKFFFMRGNTESHAFTPHLPTSTITPPLSTSVTFNPQGDDEDNSLHFRTLQLHVLIFVLFDKSSVSVLLCTHSTTRWSDLMNVWKASTATNGLTDVQGLVGRTSGFDGQNEEH